MELLYIVLGIIGLFILLRVIDLFQAEKKEPREFLKNTIKQLKEEVTKLNSTEQYLRREIEHLKSGIKNKDELYEMLIAENEESISKIASLYSDHMLMQYDISSQYLRTKSHPAYREAERIDELRNITEGYLKELNQLKYRYTLIEKRFPDLSKYLENIDYINEFDDNYTLNALKKIADLKDINSHLEETINEIKEKHIKEIEIIRESHNKEISGFENELERIIKVIREKDALFESLKFEKNSIAKITSLFADHQLIQYSISESYLRNKYKPAIQEAKRINELKQESKKYIEQFRQMIYKYEALLQLFPELSNYVDDFDTIKELEHFENIETLKEDYDRVQFYLSREEYKNLSTNKRNQLALDRYISGQKTKWQIGRDYELFCGMTYENEGWNVEYIGMEKKLNDMGRDLIAIKGLDHHIIQCKYWSQGKIIHEKHITQLFGTTIMYSLEKPNHVKVTPVFMTNIYLSDEAKKFAGKLGVLVKEGIKLEEFARIKCNINKGEDGYTTRIYHLPFDQQYDKTKINKEDEFYAFTVKEAVKAGFRRAYRYYGK